MVRQRHLQRLQHGAALRRELPDLCRTDADLQRHHMRLQRGLLRVQLPVHGGDVLALRVRLRLRRQLLALRRHNPALPQRGDLVPLRRMRDHGRLRRLRDVHEQFVRPHRFVPKRLRLVQRPQQRQLRDRRLFVEHVVPGQPLPLLLVQLVERVPRRRLRLGLRQLLRPLRMRLVPGLVFDVQHLVELQPIWLRLDRKLRRLAAVVRRHRHPGVVQRHDRLRLAVS